MPVDYFFSGTQYIRVTRSEFSLGSVDPGYPAPISNWGWPADFGASGIDAALNIGSKCYFFSGNQYVRVTREVLWPGTVDEGFPRPISDWGWGFFGSGGIDAALWSGDVLFFFSGAEYIKVRRNTLDDTDFGTVDPGYPAPMVNWKWGTFGQFGINAALYAGSKVYFFQGNSYLRVSRGMEGAGFVDKGYPASLNAWNWGSFGQKGIDAALNSSGSFVTQPPGGLVSNMQYFVDANGATLNEVEVTVNVDTDFNSTKNGYSFQLNCFSQAGEHITTKVQQYVIYSAPHTSELRINVNNWKAVDPDIKNDLVCLQNFHLCNMSHIAIKAGYIFQFILHTDDADRVVACRFIVIDNNGKIRGDRTITLTSLKLWGTSKHQTVANEAPIVALTFNIGGDYNTHQGTFTSGAGTISYHAAQSLNVDTFEPDYTGLDAQTEETGNIVFGQLPIEVGGGDVSQLFQVTENVMVTKRVKREGRQLFLHRIPDPKMSSGGEGEGRGR